MGGDGAILWEKLGKDTQIHAVFQQFQTKVISKDKLFDFLKKLSLYVQAVKTIMTSLIQGMDKAMQSKLYPRK
jgi:hypothetical protein